MQELHAGSLEGHLGEDKTVGKIKQHFYWPGMQQVIVSGSALAQHVLPVSHPLSIAVPYCRL